MSYSSFCTYVHPLSALQKGTLTLHGPQTKIQELELQNLWGPSRRLLNDLGFGNNFFNRTPNVCNIKEINKLASTMKNFCSSNDSAMKLKTADLKEMYKTDLTEELCLKDIELSAKSNSAT